MEHKTVLLHEAVEHLLCEPGDTVVDATYGAGGHASAIVERLDKTGCYIGIDADQSAFTQAAFKEAKCQVHLVHDNFKNIAKILSSLHIENVDAMLADLGWRMEQFADGEKGFSFQHDGPLTMTFGDPQTYTFTARDILNDWEESTIADILFGYGEERFARRIAKAIVRQRQMTPLETTKDLVAVVETAYPKQAKRGRTHVATKTFQALRIAVNEELPALEQFIKDGFVSLASGGRMGIITFHSIEDRVVKHSFREYEQAGLAERVLKKPLVPSSEEIKNNPRARSAKLRIIKKT